MKESSEIEPINYGPAAIAMTTGERGIEVSFSTIITGLDVMNEPLQISEVEDHTCIFDEEAGKAERIVKGTRIKADVNKMKTTRDTRKAQGRKIETVKTKNNEDIEK